VIPLRLWWAYVLACACWAQDLAGVIDLHAHCDPDSMARSIDGIALARLAQSRGMRGLVLKNHYESTAGLAYLARQAAPGLEVFGGIALNRAVGGLNPAAVDQMSRVKGQWGRVVWMPTFDAENNVKKSGEKRPFVAVTRDGRLLPDVKDVLAVVAKANLTLATGHLAPEETFLLIEEAKCSGVRRIVVTHATLSPVEMTVEQMRRAARMGAWVEFVYSTVKAPDVEAMRAAGPEHIIASSDLGQAGNPLHPDGLAEYIRAMRKLGFTQAEIDLMFKRNPAAALGVDPLQ
jgi:hypothetical protein